MSTQGIRFILTYPQCNGTNKEALLDSLRDKLKEKLVHAVVCKEDHKETTGEHYHAYIKLDIRRRIRADNLVFNGRRPNLELVSRTVRKAIDYVKKDGDFIEFGHEELKLDKKEKITYALTHTLKENQESGLFSFSELRSIPILKAQIDNNWPMDGSKEREVYWFYGKTGTGKTREAVRMMIEKLNEDWISLTGNLRQFFDPYSGQKGVIFDDLRKGSIVWNQLLVLTDRYRTQVNIKGSICPWLAEIIIITAPVPPEELFIDENGEAWDDIQQLLRRIKKIQLFN